MRILHKHWGLTLVAGLAMALPIVLAVVIYAFFEVAVWQAPPGTVVGERKRMT